MLIKLTEFNKNPIVVNTNANIYVRPFLKK